MSISSRLWSRILPASMKARHRLPSHLISKAVGEWAIEHASTGNYADFEEQANYKYFEKTYPWLHSVSGGLGIDAHNVHVLDEYPDIEAWLASIPHDSWQAFITDLEEMQGDGWIYKNEDIAQELRTEAEEEWMKADGWPDLVTAMRDAAVDYDAYGAYLQGRTSRSGDAR
jgi:hypothetical protein